MKKHFYSHIIEIDSLFVELDLLDMQRHEREELIVIVESSVHHMVMDVVLSGLSEEDKRRFLSHLAEDRHEDIWKLLHEKNSDIEKQIRKAVDTLKSEFRKDIAMAHRKKHLSQKRNSKSGT